MKTQKILLGIIFLFLLSNFSFSLPRFALRLQDKCIDCHYNPTGGIIRNDGGYDYGKYVITMYSPRDTDFTTTQKIASNISIGFDYRTQFLYSSEKEDYDFHQMTGSLYTNFALAKKVNVVGRYDFLQEIWEAYGVAHILPNNGYLKAGSFQPNFGLRIDDHTAYTRGGDLFLLSGAGNPGLIYNPYYTEVGIEAGIYVSDWAFFTASAGQGTYSFNPSRPFSNDPTYTTRLELTPSIGKVGLMLGGSYASIKFPAKADFYGFFGGFGMQRFSLMGEFDLGNDIIGEDLKSNFLMVEGAYLIIVGLEAVVRYDRVDPDTDTDKDELQRVVMGFEWMPYSFIEIRPQYRLTIEDPSETNDSIVLQFHFWY
jgi:hypothetical protein